MFYTLAVSGSGWIIRPCEVVRKENKTLSATTAFAKIGRNSLGIVMYCVRLLLLSSMVYYRIYA